MTSTHQMSVVRFPKSHHKMLKKKQWLLDFANTEFGKRPIAEIKAPEILDGLRKIEKRGRHETATSARGTIGAVFRSTGAP
jgi:integrase